VSALTYEQLKVAEKLALARVEAKVPGDEYRSTRWLMVVQSRLRTAAETGGRA
jgi:hypothetical protein